jgi:hypothetical protein
MCSVPRNFIQPHTGRCPWLIDFQLQRYISLDRENLKDKYKIKNYAKKHNWRYGFTSAVLGHFQGIRIYDSCLVLITLKDQGALEHKPQTGCYLLLPEHSWHSKASNKYVFTYFVLYMFKHIIHTIQSM